jgi:hypothetical protein
MAKEVKDPKLKEKIEKWKETSKIIERGQQAARSSLGGSIGWTEAPSRLDYAYWASLSSWTERESAALSLGLDPREDHRNDRRFVDRLRLIDRAVRDGELGEYPYHPVTLLAWLKSRRLALPTELEKLVRKAFPPKKARQDGRASTGGAKENDEKVIRLEAEMAKLMAEKEGLSAELNQMRASTSHQHVRTLHKVVYLLLSELYPDWDIVNDAARERSQYRDTFVKLVAPEIKDHRTAKRVLQNVAATIAAND